MLKATFNLVQERTLKTAVKKYKENSISELDIVVVCDGVIGDNQAVMSVIGALADMGENSLTSVDYYPRALFNRLHGCENA
jgi:hypothetical protein